MSGEVVVALRDVTKVYGATTALSGVTVEVPRGSTGLVGANGAGKTTLFRLLLGLARPTGGTLEVCGRSVAADPEGVRARLGFMPEHDCLPLDQSAADVVASFGELGGLPPRAARQRASDVLDLVGLDEARFRPVGGYSTGMRQRAKLAQAIVTDPELVLLDEPTAGLDPTGRQEMLTLVGRLATFGISVIMSTHLLDDVQQVCDHVVMLSGGTLVEAGPTDALVQASGVLSIDVGSTEGAHRLATALHQAGTPAAVVDGLVEAAVPEDQRLLVTDLVADLGLPLHRLTDRVSSLDDVFVARARAGSASAGAEVGVEVGAPAGGPGAHRGARS